MPLAEAEEAFGKEYCSLRTQTGWVGQGGFLLTDHCDEGRSMQIIAGWSDRGPWEHEGPFVEWEKDRLRRDLEGWGDVGEAMLKVSLLVRVFTNWEDMTLMLCDCYRSSSPNPNSTQEPVASTLQHPRTPKAPSASPVTQPRLSLPSKAPAPAKRSKTP